MTENDFTSAVVRRAAINHWDVVEPHGDKMEQMNKHLLGKAMVW